MVSVPFADSAGNDVHGGCDYWPQNFRPHFEFESGVEHVGWIESGWPLTARREYAGVVPLVYYDQGKSNRNEVESAAKALNEADKFYLPGKCVVVGFKEKSFVSLGLVVDVVILIALLGLVGTISEVLLRRHKFRS